MSVISLKNIAEINVLKLKNNLFSIKKSLQPGVAVCAVVKADAYGHGAVRIANYVERLVDYFAVSLVEEGVELRIAGVKKPILVLIPTDLEGLSRAAKYDLTVTVASFGDIKKLKQTRKNIACHIKINTGMNRFGFDLNEIDCACTELIKSGVDVCGCFSHFACPQDASLTSKQFEKFLTAKGIVSKYFNNVRYHISASGGILCGKRYCLDMVRPGLLLYGYKPFACDSIHVEPILKIISKKLLSRNVCQGEQLLYGDYKLKSSEKISIVRTGYADGFLRSDGNVYNNRCMDVSATGYADTDEVVTFFNAEDVSRRAGTITYDILCGITRRARIIYKE